MASRIIMARHRGAGQKPDDAPMSDNDTRLALIQHWLRHDLRMRVARIEPASSDASFRRYFRVYSNEQTYVVMDAPPGKEDVRPYVRVSGMLEAIGAHVPHIHEQDEARGMLLLEDLGTTLYLQQLLAGDDSEHLYGDALDALAVIQVQGRAHCAQLAPYGRSELARELALMPEWFLAGHLGLTLSEVEQRMVEETFEFLIRQALAQPRVFVHRDYHARNLMVVASRNPGIIDFQDALAGPVGYDLVSLLKDCYIAWPRGRVIEWVQGFRARLLSSGGEAGRSEEEFVRWFDLVGAQRHIKVLGIFCRLWYRDGKSGYLGDLPRTLDYVRDVCGRYTELAPMARFIEARVVPELPRANERARQQHSAGAGA
jgi:N-acetylmuramate 1-kinase